MESYPWPLMVLLRQCVNETIKVVKLLSAENGYVRYIANNKAI